MGTTFGLFRWKPFSGQPAVSVLQYRLAVNCVVAHGNDLWIGTGGGGLYWCDTTPPVTVPNWAKNAENVSAIHAVGDSLWYATGYPAGQGDAGALCNFSIPKVKSGDPQPAVSGATSVQTSAGYIRALDAVGNSLWLAGEKGFYRFLSTNSSPEQTNTIPREIIGIHRHGDWVWVVTKTQLYQLEGFNKRPWTPMVTLVEKPPSSLFTETHASIKWQVKDLHRRTSTDHVRFEVVFTKEGVSGEFLRAGADRLNESKGDLISTTFGVSRILPVGTYRYEIHAWDLNDNEGVAGFDSEKTQAVLPEPFGVRSLVLYRFTLIAAAVGIVLLISALLMFFFVRFRRFVFVILLFQRYTMTPGTCDNHFEVKYRKAGVYRITYISSSTKRSNTFVDVRGGWPSDTKWLKEARNKLLGKNVLVLVDDQNFHFPFAYLIGGKWSLSDASVIAGQVIDSLEPPEPLRHTDLRFAVLGCTQAQNMTPLPGAEPEARAVEGSFRSTKAKVITRNRESALEAATREDFEWCLQKADVVHVATHASAREIRLANGSFSADEIDPLFQSHQIRCRLLVLSACEAAAFEGVERSLASLFVSRGIAVLASLKRIDDDFCEFFFPAFYKYWLPHGVMSDMDLGGAIRQAAADWNQSEAKKQQTNPARRRDLGSSLLPVYDSLDTLVLFGDPSLKIRLRLL